MVVVNLYHSSFSDFKDAKMGYKIIKVIIRAAVGPASSRESAIYLKIFQVILIILQTICRNNN
jgi:hypothetical protein